MKREFHFFILALAFAALTACQSASKKNQAAFAHLDNYRSLECEITGEWAAPVLAGWERQTGRAVEARFDFRWRATPHRCNLSGLSGSTDDVKDARIKMNWAFCTGLQAFYSESPLRESPSLGPDSVVVSEKQDSVRANLPGGGHIQASYFFQFGQLVPKSIEQTHDGSTTRLADIIYDQVSGRVVPKQFWLYVPSSGGPSAAYIRADIKQCKLNR